MKNLIKLRYILVVFLILSSSLPAFGQNNSNFLIDSVTKYVKYSWQPGDASMLGRSKNFYDLKNQLTLLRYWAMDNTTNPQYYQYYYSNNKLDSFELVQDGCPFFKANISYDANGRTTDSITQTRYNCQPLKNGNRYSYEYNKTGLKSTYTSYNWTAVGWTPIRRTSFNYDSRKNLIEEVFENSDTNGLYIVNKFVYLYDEEVNLTESQEFRYIDENWVKDSWIKYYYANSHLTERQYYSAKDTLDALIKVDSLFYDEDLIVLEKQYSLMDGVRSLTNSTRRTYDKNKLMIKLDVSEIMIKDSTTTTTEYMYISANGSAVENNPAINIISISPNPAGDFITINLGNTNPTLKRGVDEVFIYNALGEMVMSVETLHATSLRINISDLPKGMYFVKVGGETVKFVKL